jgi:hypothetical protein
VLERINALGDNLISQIAAVRDEVGSLRNEFQLFRAEVEIRLDRIEGMTNQTRSEFLNFRADFKELSARVS